MTNNDSQSNLDELAQAIARGLGEEESLPIFRALIRRYPEEIIRRAYEETLEIPPERVRKSKGAIFNFLLKKYARQGNNQDPGH
jgi:hypothetical protein